VKESEKKGERIVELWFGEVGEEEVVCASDERLEAKVRRTRDQVGACDVMNGFLLLPYLQ